MKNQPTALLFGTCLAVAGMMLSPGRGMAQNYTISNGGSFATVNVGGGTGSIGMNDWSVGNGNVMQNELNQQWFWYQIGSTGTVYSIDNLGLSGTPVISSADGGNNNELSVTYASAQLSVNIVYELLGSGMGSGTANIYEGITLAGLNGLSQNVNFFQYSNFNLLGNSANTVQVFPDGSGGYYYAQQNAGSTAIAEGIISPDANNAEAGTAAATLADVEAGTLNGNQLAGPGNVAWAFEWNAADGNLNIAKSKELSVQGIPEPSSFALIGLGLGAMGLLRRRMAS